MEIVSITDNSQVFQIFLLNNITKINELKAYSEKETTVVLNPELILNSTHLAIALERSVVAMKKKKLSKPHKKDIIYYCSNSGKTDICLANHAINFDNKEKPHSCFLILIDSEKTYLSDEISELFGCEVYDSSNFSYFTNIQKIKKEFEIEDIEDNLDTGLLGAIYNRLSLKDLK